MIYSALGFFRQSNPPRLLTNRLRPFRILIRQDLRFGSRRIYRRIRSQMRNGFNQLVRDLGGNVQYKNLKHIVQ
jgi:hypothetical protein